MEEERDFPEDLAVRVRGITKTYRLGIINRGTFRDELIYRWERLRGHDPRQSLGRIGGHEMAEPELFRALDDVSFDIRKGETVGLIGRNGAGKSTMLKILARITTPTTGEAWIRGRVGSMLEVGTGFHPELTGRENIYLNGTILGMSKREIDAKFDEIVEFSEIGEFLDTPVKRYSSGMYVKLAFAVASSLDNDVLLLDEVLAVGDAAFQKKCLDRMKDIVDSGRTILFVSHSISNIRAICSRCIWFDHGRVLMEGDTAEVADVYSEYCTLPGMSIKDYLVWRPLPPDPFRPTGRMAGVVRFRNLGTDTHFLTRNRDEMEPRMAQPSEWRYDGVVFRPCRSDQPGFIPLFRFISRRDGCNAFAVGDAEADPYRRDPSAWTEEGPLCLVFPDERPNTVPVFRLSRADRRGVLLAVGEKERDSMLSSDHALFLSEKPFFGLSLEG